MVSGKNFITKIKTKCGIDFWAGTCLVMALFFMLFIYAPVELYCYNQREFWFDLYDILPVMIVVFVVSSCLAMIVMMGINCICSRLCGLLIPFVSVVYLCTYIQGTYLVEYLPPMDGTYVNWDKYAIGRTHSTILWCVVFFVVCVIYALLKRERFARLMRIVGICMTLMLTVTMATVLLTTRGYEPKPDACTTVEYEYEFSEDTNFIIFVLDAADSETLYKMMEENSEYKDIFEDFTYYANAMAAYPYTLHSVPFILSGEWYLNEGTLDDYTINAYRNSSFLNSLEERGYKLGMYEQEMVYWDESVFRFANVLPLKSEVSSYVEFAKLQIKLVGIRYAPFDLKKYCKIWADAFINLQEINGDGEAFSLNNAVFYERLQKSEVCLIPEKCFKFIHIEGAHIPFVYDKDVNKIADGDYVQNMEASMTITEAYLKKLKESGIYDNSVIIVMADHGFNAEDEEAIIGRQHPILLVKGIDEHHEMNISQAPIAFEDLQEAFRRLMNGSDSAEIFDWKEGDQRERRFLWYSNDAHEYMYESIQYGHASDENTLLPSGKEYIR